MSNLRHIWKEAGKAWSAYTFLAKIQLILGALFICTITLDQRTNSSFLILLSLSLALDFSIGNFKANKQTILVFIAIFIISLVSLVYTENLREGKMVIERQLAVFFLPLLYFSAKSRFDGFKLKFILFFFFNMATVVSVYLNAVSYLKFKESNRAAGEWFIKENLYHAFAAPVNMHATFLSLYIGMAIFIGFYWLFKPSSWFLKLLTIVALLSLITTLMLLSSRIVIISVLLTSVVVYPFFIKKPKSKLSVILMALVMGLILYAVMQESSFVKDRFAKKIAEEVRMTAFLNPDSTYNPIYGGETRADRWYCAFELIKERPFLGYGAGQEKGKLMEKYQKYNLQNAVVNNYDAHNQYLSFGIKTGITGMLLFLMAIVYAVYIAIKHRNFLYLGMMLLFAFTCVTESVLESNKGIFFYAFFNSVLACYCISGNALPKREKDLTGDNTPT